MALSSAGKAFLAALVLGLAFVLQAVKNRKKALQRKKWDGWGRSKYVVLPKVSDKSKEIGASYVLRPTDVVILTFPKTGTTWLQQICEQLRTGGDMKFDEITERQPWLEFAWDLGQDLDAEQVAVPRLFKSHQRPSAINPGGKYLAIVRDPKATLISYFNFMRTKQVPPFSKISDINEYAKIGHFDTDKVFGTNIWEYYAELWEARNDPNVLVLCYETMMKDTKTALPVIASFLGVPSDQSRCDTALKMASKDFMAAHESHFDDHFLVNRLKANGSKFHMVASAKVTSGHKDVLTQETQDWLERMWAEKVTPRTGLANYKELCNSLAA